MHAWIPAIRILATGLLMALLLSCATKTQIPPEHIKDYAMLVPRQNNNSIIGDIDGKSPGLSLSGDTVNLLPGRHKVETTSCLGGTNTCKPDIYIFEARPGMAYVFHSPEIVEVYDRFHMDKPRVGYLHDVGNRQFVDDREYSIWKDQAAHQAANDKAAIEEYRRLTLPQVRKVGAKICQERTPGVIYIGYVETVAEEKVQIRIADAEFKGSPGTKPAGFAPTIVWESPMEWSLCN